MLSRIFLWLPRKFATSNFAISNFQERSSIFRFKLYEKSFEKSTTFHGKFAKTKDDFRRISFALLLHNTVPVLLSSLISALPKESNSINYWEKKQNIIGRFEYHLLLSFIIIKLDEVTYRAIIFQTGFQPGAGKRPLFIMQVNSVKDITEEDKKEINVHRTYAQLKQQ